MRSCWLVIVMVAACSKSGLDDDPDRYAPLAASAFHEQLTDRDTAALVESVRVEPQGVGRARYIVTLKTSAKRSAVIAEYPGTLIDEVFRAGIPYSVKPRGLPYEARTHELDAGAFRRMLVDPDEVARIEDIQIVPTAEGAANYRVRLKTEPILRSIYAEYPGTILDAIRAAKIRVVE